MIDPKIIARSQFSMLELERHSNIPFGDLPVLAMGFPEARKMVSQWWHPSYRARRSSLYRLLMGILTRGKCRTLNIASKPIPILARVIIDYPLNDPFEALASIDAREFGEVFGIAYDMYRHVYELDDHDWIGRGHRSPPRNSEIPGNRANGKYVWGHDIGDLRFEELLFAPDPEIESLDPEILHEEPVFIGTIAWGIGS